jgi:DNA-binding response OmpR family regulator
MAKLLLVEDDLDLTTFYQTLLRANGYDVTPATDGEDGWAKLTTQSFDIVLLDIMMPKLDGIGFLKRREHDDRVNKVPVVMMTNVGTDEVLSQCFKLGVKYYILKVEVNPPDVLQILEKAMQKDEQPLTNPQ